jgi:adenosine deaminase
MEDELVALPKAHLHLHLVGSMRPSTLAELAAEAETEVPDVTGDVGGWRRFAARYEAASALVRTPAHLRRLVDEIVADEAACGTRWVEITTNPALYADRSPELADPVEVLECLLEAGERAWAQHGVGVGWVVAADRAHTAYQAAELARLAAAHAGHGVVGFGLANDERRQPASVFRTAFRIARRAGLLSVPHAGELRGADEVVDAVELLGAHRIGHGVGACEDPAAVARLAEAGVCLELCPTSNLEMGIVGRIEDHPLPTLAAAGVPVCVNADDPLLFGESLLDEYRTCRDALGVSRAGLADLAETSLRHAACPDDLRRRALADLEAWRAGEATG